MTLGLDGSETVTFTVSRSELGYYDVSIEDLFESFRVSPPPTAPFPTILLLSIALHLSRILLGYSRRKGED